MADHLVFAVRDQGGAACPIPARRGGGIFEEQYEITNTSRLPKLWLEVANETAIPFATGSRVLTFIRGRQKRSYTARTWLIARGGFVLGPTRITSGDPFGIFRVSKISPAKESLVVLPMIASISGFLSPPGLLPGGQVQCRGIVLRARKALGEDLGSCSMLDLVADNITHVSLSDLRAALVIAGVGYQGRTGRE